VFRYSLREMLMIMLVVALSTGWWTEKVRAKQWRQRAEIAAGHLESEKLGKIVFGDKQVTYQSEQYAPPFRELNYPTDGSP
jgi:hypothetical protein